MGEATKYTPPNIKQFDHPPTKKCRTMDRTPEKHVPINIMPTPEAGCSTVKTAYVVLDPLSPPTPGPSRSAHLQTSDEPPHTIPPSAPRPFTQTSRTRLMVLLDCLASLNLPTTMELLSLMDHYECGEKRYIDLHEELVDLGIKNAVELFELPVEILASFGWLHQSSASRLQRFCRDKLLVPLGFVEEDSSSDYNSPSAQSVLTIESSSDEDGDDEGVMVIMSSQEV